MRVHRLSAAAFALGGLLLTGCSGFVVKPPKPASMPRADAPLPLKVGVRLKKSRFEWQGMGMMNTDYMERHHDRGMFRPMWAQADDVDGQFLRALQASSAFSRVDMLAGSGSGDRDLIIDADFSGKYTQDPAGTGKAVVTGALLFLPAMFITYEDSYFAAAEVSVRDAAGNVLRKYSERQDAKTSAMIFSAGTADSVSAGIESAAANLAAKLVKLIIDDRDAWKPSTKPAAKSEPVAARKTFRVDDEPKPDEAGLMKTFRIDDEAESKPTAAARPRGNTFRIDDEPRPAPAPAPAPARAAPVERVIANAEKAQAELVSEEARTDPAPSQAALTSAEEREIDEQVMP